VNLEDYAGMNSVQILNYYRNMYYTDGNNTEKGIVANAINDVLPKIVHIINESKESK